MTFRVPFTFVLTYDPAIRVEPDADQCREMEHDVLLLDRFSVTISVGDIAHHHRKTLPGFRALSL